MPGKRRRVFPVITAAVAIPAALLVAAGASARPAAPQPTGWQPQIVLAAPNGSGFAHYVVSPSIEVSAGVGSSEPTMSTLVASRSRVRTLPPGVGIERGLQVRTILVERAISARFPEVTNIGGVRQDSLHWHPSGLAIDVMIPHYNTQAGKDLGDRIVAFVFQNADRFGIDNVIWQQTYYPVNGNPRRMADLGNDDANHYTHVHIATTGGGYPSGGETYYG
ncbi:MAG TPA: hypothetical protein PKK01_13950 [Mycobacterium sp.]|nr:hypothetical protein [Mycobacterium sp.]HPZ94678.1 hypothetical protein [Mycobacterium sp.]HQE15339.1 hypothetical protein [Mycobacterium sp.]